MLGIPQPTMEHTDSFSTETGSAIKPCHHGSSDTLLEHISKPPSVYWISHGNNGEEVLPPYSTNVESTGRAGTPIPTPSFRLPPEQLMIDEDLVFLPRPNRNDLESQMLYNYPQFDPDMNMGTMARVCMISTLSLLLILL